METEEKQETAIVTKDEGLINSAIVQPMVSAEQAKKAWVAYQELKKAFLDPNIDYQVINVFVRGKGMIKKPFIKKSGWRKLATAFNLSVEIIKEERKEY